MLWDVMKNQLITRIPHKSYYDTWISRMSEEELQDIREEILRRIQGDEVATAGWIPGADWNGTPFFKIFDKACNRDENAAGMCFGLIVWTTFMEHEDRWGFGRYELNDLPIQSMTYFKVHP